MDAIIVKEVSKSFNENCVLDNVTVSFESGKIHGLIGRNGAGKTVLLKLICGLGTPTEGEIWIGENEITQDARVPDNIGAIIEVPGFLADISGFSNLKYLAGLKGKIGDTEISDAISAVGLDPKDKKRVGKYSLGMRQRLGIAQAIMEDPDILILDEPMNGLDNQGVKEVKQLLMALRDRGKTIILASHHMEDINELCDTVYEMEAGILTHVRGLE